MALGATANVLAAMPDVNGGLWVHPDGLVPVDKLPKAKTDLKEEGFVAVGFLSEDGLTESTEIDTDKKKAWGGVTIKVVQNDFTKSFQFTLVEAANLEVLRLVYGKDNVKVEDGVIVITETKEQRPHLTWVIEVTEDNNKIRDVIADGQIIERGDINWTHSEILQHEVTLESFEDSSGAFSHQYITPAVPPVDNGDGDNDGGDDEGETPAP